MIHHFTYERFRISDYFNPYFNTTTRLTIFYRFYIIIPYSVK